MRRVAIRMVMVGVLFSAFVLASAPASARDMCLQFSGQDCDFTGQAGFFRFKGKLPRNKKKFVPVHGRNAGITGVYGTATMDTEESMISLTASFTQDAVFGTIDVFIDPANLNGTHFGSSSYGDIGLGQSCDVDIVDCDLEP